MAYIAEILSSDVVWVITQHRQLVSIHLSLEEANYYCRKHFNTSPNVVDRRQKTGMVRKCA